MILLLTFLAVANLKCQKQNLKELLSVVTMCGIRLYVSARQDYNQTRTALHLSKLGTKNNAKCCDMQMALRILWLVYLEIAYQHKVWLGPEIVGRINKDRKNRDETQYVSLLRVEYFSFFLVILAKQTFIHTWFQFFLLQMSL